MTTLNITTGSITIADPISASFAATASTVLNAPVGSINGMAYFTSSTTWTIPEGIKKVKVIAVGGGGGGCGNSDSGGGGGGYVENVISVEGYSTLPITVGIGGSGGVFAGQQGQTGGMSGILYVTASGGNGAGSGTTVNGGSGSFAIIIFSGGSGNGLLAGKAGGPLYGTSIGEGGYGSGISGKNGAVILYY